MPFTFSHPAIVLPLNLLPSKWVSLTALVIGSLMPDLEAFIRFSSEKAQSHTWAALFWFCLPAGMAISLLYHLLVRNPFICNLPPFLQKRFERFTRFQWLPYVKNNFVAVVISFLVGGASHLLWDSFSHYDGLLLWLDPGLTGNTTVLGHTIEIPYLIQYLNSLLGLLVILVVIVRLPAQKQIVINKKWWQYWGLVALITAAVFGLRWALMDAFKIDDVIVSFFMAFIIGVFIASLVRYQKYKRLAE